MLSVVPNEIGAGGADVRVLMSAISEAERS